MPPVPPPGTTPSTQKHDEAAAGTELTVGQAADHATANGSQLTVGVHDQGVMQTLSQVEAAREASDLALINEAIKGNIDASELKYARAAILQPQSPEIVQQVVGFKMGQIINNLTREIYSVEGQAPWLLARQIPKDELPKINYALFLPVFKLPSEFIKWKDRNTEGKGWHFKELDPRLKHVREGMWKPRGTWQPPKEGEKGKRSPPVTENCNFFGLMLDPHDFTPMSDFLVQTFAKTSFATGTSLVSKLNTHEMFGLPYWGNAYYLFTKQEQGDGNTWYEYKLGPALAIHKHEIYRGLHQTCKGISLALADKTLYQGEGENFDALGLPLTIGRMRQEMVINSANLEDAEETPTGDGTKSEGDVF